MFGAGGGGCGGGYVMILFAGRVRCRCIFFSFFLLFFFIFFVVFRIALVKSGKSGKKLGLDWRSLIIQYDF